MKYSIIISERNESENLKQTIANIQETQRGEFEIIAISDQSGKGCAYCRNEGINRAKNDIVIITDAHMRFKPGALDTQAEYTAANLNHISCLKCHHNAKMTFNDNPYMGARFIWKSKERDQHWILHGKWRKQKTTGEIPCVMGACYGLSKSNYVEKLKSPLRFGKGWGMDEEMLCITNWLCGGKTVLLDLECAHLYRLQKDIPYNLTHENILGVWANRLSLLQMLPLSKPDFSELTAWLEKNNDFINNLERITGIISESDINKQKRYFEIQERSFSQWKEIFITEGDEDMKRGRASKNQAGKVENRETPVPVVEKRTYTVASIVKDGGIPCPHCGHRHDHKVTNTYPNNRRRFECAKCKGHFISDRT